MFKKIMKSALIGVSLLAFGSIANAAEYDINMYGASAEYNYWNASDVAFLTFLGCGAADIYKAHTADSNHSVTFCAGNTAFAGKSGAGATYAADGLAGDTVVLRYSNKASYDGIEAVQGLDAFNTNNGNGCTNKQRMMGDETNAGTNFGTNTLGGTKCTPVNVAASDVHASTFNETTNGVQNGPQGGSMVNRTVAGLTIPSIYTNKSPLSVPFAFFVNNSIAGSVTNMTRLMATQIFAGQITDWQQLGLTAASTPITVCLRHSGSGTLATLDAAVMRGDYTLLQTENYSGAAGGYSALSPITYFNDGTSTELYCIANEANAVGIADADKPNVSGSTGYTQITYQGAVATRVNIRNGVYDYWSPEELYYSTNASAANPLNATQGKIVATFVTYASNPANLPASENTWWAASSEMSVLEVYRLPVSGPLIKNNKELVR